MTTYQQLIDKSRMWLMTSTSDRINVLQADINSSVTIIQLQYSLKGIDNGSRIAIGTEEMFVLEVSGVTPGSNVTVIRGFEGSTAAAHTTGDIVRINPQFSDFRILTALNECITSLSSDGMFRAKTEEFTYIPSQAGYQLANTDVIDILSVRYDTPGPNNNWPMIPAQMWEFNSLANTTDFPSGHSLVLKMGGHPGFPIRVTYKANYTISTTLSDDVLTATGLFLSAHDIPPMGAAIRLNMGRDIKRTFLNRQPEPRRQDEVPPNSAQGAIQTLTALYYRAIEREIKYLHRLYPTQIS